MAEGRWSPVLFLLGALAGCGKPSPTVVPASRAAVVTPRDTIKPPIPAPPPPEKVEPILPPQRAFLAGMMPLHATGIDSFRLQRPTWDGRGVIIGILDSGVDPGLPGFRATTTDQQKLLDVRDFSGEGLVELQPLTPASDGSVVIGGHQLVGFGRIARLAEPPYYGGVFRELPLGEMPAADLNGNGNNTDEFPVVVAKSTSGWFVMTDVDGDGSLENETPVYDYAMSGQSFSYYQTREKLPTRGEAIAVNLSEENGRPVLDFVFDNSGHGSHVAGIAAGHNMFGLGGFDGVAPGAQLLGIKISNNARGGISVTGSMLRGMNFAADFAIRRGLPLILNLSFGVGNETEGEAAIDSLINEFSLKHPDVLFVVSAGNDGPGLSTVGFPGSADMALTVCALFPGVFTQPPDATTPVPPDVIGYWSARGGEVAKPEVCAPGVAYSNVPPWHTGEEISGGTSMAAPQVAGLAAVLQSAIGRQGGRVLRAVDLKRAIVATARPLPGVFAVEQGTGVPNVGGAYRWLLSAHQSGTYHITAADDGGNQSRADGAYRRSGLASPADTIQHFTVNSVGGQSAARLLFKSDAHWLRAPAATDLHGGPETITVTYDATQLKKPGLYVGTVWATSATDTLAGPLFALINTIVVPLPLDEPLKVRETLAAGRFARYFVTLPEGGGGLTARISVPDEQTNATLFFFEPNGMPYRGGPSVEVGGKDSTSVVLRVNADDVVAGVYEVAVQAPPNAGATYTLELGVPRVSVAAPKAAGNVVVRNLTTESLSTAIGLQDEGSARDTTVTGSGSNPVTLAAQSPAWADRMVVDVRFDRALWNTVTDFGLTVFDNGGQILSRGPMNYAFTRQVIKMDSLHRDRRLQVELYPAFAHLKGDAAWSAAVRVVFLRHVSIPLPVPDPGTMVIAPGGIAEFLVPSRDDAPGAVSGTHPLVRVTATPAGGVASVRRELW